MNVDFIVLNKLGVGDVLVRYAEIVKMEPTNCGCTNIHLSTGEYLIVEQGPIQILRLISNSENLIEELEKTEKTELFGALGRTRTDTPFGART